MITSLLYVTVVLIWGSTWLAVRYQVGIVPPEASVAYRIGLAALLMFTWTVLRRLPLRFSVREHFFMALQGALIFSTNFFLFYHAAAYLTTGLIAVIFSTASAMTMIINSVLTNQRPSSRVVFGALLGILGIGCIFFEELLTLSIQSGVLFGVLLSIGGTLSFSAGSIVSARNRLMGFSVCGNTSWSMFYGTLLLTLFLFGSGRTFTFDPHLPYVVSLLYLSIIGSIVAFAAYFALLGRITAERSAYATVLFPLVALSLSTMFEGYQWTISALVGVVIILIGNILVHKKPGSTR
ncbi:EamA family transporter [bacterium]|nr:EamA family transporter [bacterium]